MFHLASWADFEAMTIAFLGWLLTFVDDMFDGNMTVLVKCYNFTSNLWNRNWIAVKFVNRFLKTMDGSFH